MTPLHKAFRRRNLYRVVISALNKIIEPRHFKQCGMWDQQRLRSACAFAQSDQSLCWSLEYYMTF